MKIRKEGIKRAVTFILTVVMISLFAVNAFAADSIRCKEYYLEGTLFHDAVEKDAEIETGFYLTPTITVDSESSCGYRISSVDMAFIISPGGYTITSLSEVSFLYNVSITYEFPNGWSGYETYSKRLYIGDFPGTTRVYESPTVTINIPKYTNSNYRGTRYISAYVEIYTNSNPSNENSGKYYTSFSTIEHIDMSTIVNQNT